MATSEHQTLLRLLGSVPTDRQGTPLVTLKTAVQKVAGYSFRIYQIGVATCRPNGLVPKKRVYGITDDNTYLNYPQLVKLVPRCYSIVEATTPSGSTSVYRLTGLPKFGGELTVDDDDLIESSQGHHDVGNIDSQDQFDSVVITEKANGKSVGLRVIHLDDEYWLYGGSKNRHRLVRYSHFKEDLSTLEEADQQLVIPILQSCYTQFSRLQQTPREALFWRLSSRDDPYTLCGEFNDGKHIVPIKKGDSPQVVWFALQQCGESHHLKEGLTSDIVGSLAWLQGLGLATICFQRFTREQFAQYQVRSRVGRGSEGFVYHYVKTIPDGEKTVSIVKHKLTWYILIRVARQIIKNAKTPERLRSIYRHKLKQTLLQRNGFLHLPIGMLSIWYELLCGFVEWMLREGHHPSEVGFDVHHQGMGNLWRDFITDNPQFTDDFLPPEEEVEKRGLGDLTESQAFPQADKLVIIMQGIPGLGKTKLGNLASEQLGEGSVTLEQDTYWSYKSRAKTKCLEQMELHLSDPKLSYIWLLRNNSQYNQYRDFVRIAREYGWKVLVLLPHELAYPNAARDVLLQVCRDAVTTRTGHVSFDSLSPDKRRGIVDSFNRGFSPATIGESRVDSISTIRWLRSDCCSREVEQLVAHRLPLEEVVGEMVAKAQHYRLEKAEPLYIAVKLPEQMRAALTEIIHTEVTELSLEGKQVYLDHLTLAHSEQMIGNEKLWQNLKGRVGNTLQIVVSSLVVVEGELGKPESVVVVAHPVEPEEGTDLTGLVLSGVPHITAVLPKGIRPKHSVEILKGKQASCVIPLEMSSFRGTVVAV